MYCDKTLKTDKARIIRFSRAHRVKICVQNSTDPPLNKSDTGYCSGGSNPLRPVCGLLSSWWRKSRSRRLLPPLIVLIAHYLFIEVLLFVECRICSNIISTFVFCMQLSPRTSGAGIISHLLIVPYRHHSKVYSSLYIGDIHIDWLLYSNNNPNPVIYIELVLWSHLYTAMLQTDAKVY